MANLMRMWKTFLIYLAISIRDGMCVPTNSPGCGSTIPEHPHPGHEHKIYVEFNDPNMGHLQREYLLHLPTHYNIQNDIPVALVLDYHGWGGDAASQIFEGSLDDVADEEKDETFIIAHLQGAGKNDHGHNVTGLGGWGSHNCSRTDGPLGPPCELPRPNQHRINCYDSCGSCDPHLSCDWTSCYDAVEFATAVINQVGELYCIDQNSIHLSGISNGGMFPYFAASPLGGILASIAPVSGTPLLGFDNIPENPISLIDFHGTNDDTIPYDLDSPHSIGIGPHNTAISWDYYYYPGKPQVIKDWVSMFSCDIEGKNYATPMDGVHDWTCSIWSNCRNGVEIVHCNGNYGHDYPFAHAHPPYIGGTRILWDFMKNHPKKE